jgi:Sec-independent protein translocase protein TatA
MILEMGFVLFLGLLVFGPKKTLEMSQAVGRSIAHFKRATSQIQSQLETEVGNLQSPKPQPPLRASILERRD